MTLGIGRLFPGRISFFVMHGSISRRRVPHHGAFWTTHYGAAWRREGIGSAQQLFFGEQPQASNARPCGALREIFSNLRKCVSRIKKWQEYSQF